MDYLAKETFRKMSNFFSSLPGLELSALLLIGLILIFGAEDAPISQSITGSSADAKEIANAISTPPAHLHTFFWQSIYHWQTLITGFFATISGVIVFLQVQKQIRSAEKIADDDRRNSIELIIHQEKLARKRVFDAETRKMISICTALICEVSVINEEFSVCIKHWNNITSNPERSFMKKHKDIEFTSLAFERYMDDIGNLSESVQGILFSVYSRALRWNLNNNNTGNSIEENHILSLERFRLLKVLEYQSKIAIQKLRRERDTLQERLESDA